MADPWQQMAMLFLAAWIREMDTSRKLAETLEKSSLALSQSLALNNRLNKEAQDAHDSLMRLHERNDELRKENTDLWIRQ